MRSCPECGRENAADAQFCVQCGEFLAWDDTLPPPSHLPDTPPPATRAVPREPSPPSGTPFATWPPPGGADRSTGDDDQGEENTTRDSSAPGGTPGVNLARDPGHSASRDAEAEPPVPPPTTDDSPSSGPDRFARPETPSGGGAEPRVPEAARRPAMPYNPAVPARPIAPPPVPSSDVTSVGESGAQLRRPGERDEQPYVAPPATEPPRVPEVVPGGSRCRSCGTDNARERTFCIRCGRPLAGEVPARPAEPPPVPIPWWKRLFRRAPEAPRAAGERPHTRSRRRRTFVAPILVVALLAAAWFGRPFYDGVFDFIRDNTSDPEAARPTGSSASSEAPEMPAKAAFDGASNRAWAPAFPGPGAQLVATFDQPVRLLKVIVSPGVSGKAEEFVAHGRPRNLTFLLVTADGKEHTTDIRLRDQAGPQTFDLRQADVREVRIRIESVYGPPDQLPAIAEVEFFRGR